MASGAMLGCILGITGGFSIFSIGFSKEFGVNHADSSALFSMYLMASAVSAPFVGKFADRYNPFKIVCFTFPLFGAALIACAHVKSFNQLYFLYIGIISLASNFTIISCQLIIANYYKTNYGKALGIAFALIGVCDFLLLTGLGNLVEYYGWRQAYLVGALVSLVTLIFFIYLACDTSILKRAPVKILHPSNASHIRKWGFLLTAAFAVSFMDFTVFQNLAPYLKTRNISTSLSGFMLGIAAFGYMAGQLIGGNLSDNYSKRLVAALSGIIFSFSILIIKFFIPIAFLFPFVWLLGLSIGCSIVCRSATIADIFLGSSLGKATGIVQIFSALGAAAGTLLGGYGYDKFGSYNLSFMASLCASCLWIFSIYMCGTPRKIIEKTV